ncbi:retrotransposable element ORF2 protein [Plecturocebus cupreus]
MPIKTKINSWDLIKLKSFCTAKRISQQRLVSRIYNELKQIIKEKANNPIKNWLETTPMKIAGKTLLSPIDKELTAEASPYTHRGRDGAKMDIRKGTREYLNPAFDQSGIRDSERIQDKKNLEKEEKLDEDRRQSPKGYMTPKAQATKEKKDKVDFKIKSFCASKDTIKRVKR